MATGDGVALAYRAGAVTELTYNRETLFLEEIVTRTGDGAALQDISMTFNGNGSITEIVDRLAAGPAPAHGHVDRSGTFHYDFRNQLVRYVRYGEDAAFEYTDAVIDALTALPDLPEAALAGLGHAIHVAK